MTIADSIITASKFYEDNKIFISERIQVKPSPELSKVCHLAKNLYNLANFLVRARFFFKQDNDRALDTDWLKELEHELFSRPARFDSIAAITQKYIKIRNQHIAKKSSENGRQGYGNKLARINYTELWRLVQYTEAYKKMNSHSAQGTLQQVISDWDSFYEAVDEYNDDKKILTPKAFNDKWKSPPSIPRYKKKNGETVAFFSNQHCRIRDGYLTFPGLTNSRYSKKWLSPVKTRIRGKFQTVRVVPRGTMYVIEIVYAKEVQDLGLNKDNVCSIDIGVRNIVTMVNNMGIKPIAVKGGVVKSINQFYNKKRAKLMYIKDKQQYSHWTKRLKKLETKRNNILNNYFHQLSKHLVDFWIENNIGSVVIGYNQQWKQEVNMGKRNNQNFVYIPFWLLIRKIMYKAYLVGITVYLVREPYTSSCSFLDGEEIGFHEYYKGVRKGGLFRASNGRVINADVNAAYNIMIKAIKDAITADEIEDAALHPRRVDWHLLPMTGRNC